MSIPIAAGVGERSKVGDLTVVDLLVGQPLVGDMNSVARRADISLAITLARTRPKQWRAAADHHRRKVYTELVHEAPLEARRNLQARPKDALADELGKLLAI